MIVRDSYNYEWDGDKWTSVVKSRDSITGAYTIIDYAHHEVHGGSAYWAANNATIGNGELNTVALTTPNIRKWAHLLLEISSTQTATFDILEDVTSFAGGAAFIPLNFNRNSDNTSELTALVGDTTGADPVVPTGGTTIWSETLGTRGIATSRTNASELILKQNSKYLFRITNGVTTNNCTILLNWYEHTNK